MSLMVLEIFLFGFGKALEIFLKESIRTLFLLAPPLLKQIQNLEIGVCSRSTLLQSHGLANSLFIILCI